MLPKFAVTDFRNEKNSDKYAVASNFFLICNSLLSRKFALVFFSFFCEKTRLRTVIYALRGCLMSLCEAASFRQLSVENKVAFDDPPLISQFLEVLLNDRPPTWNNAGSSNQLKPNYISHFRRTMDHSKSDWSLLLPSPDRLLSISKLDSFKQNFSAFSEHFFISGKSTTLLGVYKSFSRTSFKKKIWAWFRAFVKVCLPLNPSIHEEVFFFF